MSFFIFSRLCGARVKVEMSTGKRRSNGFGGDRGGRGDGRRGGGGPPARRGYSPRRSRSRSRDRFRDRKGSRSVSRDRVRRYLSIYSLNLYLLLSSIIFIIQGLPQSFSFPQLQQIRRLIWFRSRTVVKKIFKRNSPHFSLLSLSLWNPSFTPLLYFLILFGIQFFVTSSSVSSNLGFSYFFFNCKTNGLYHMGAFLLWKSCGLTSCSFHMRNTHLRIPLL